MKGMTLFTSQ